MATAAEEEGDYDSDPEEAKRSTTAAEEEGDYDSDPEEAKRSLTMRRREASDDEDGEGEEREGHGLRVVMHSDESDSQGGVAEYDDDGELREEYEEEEDVYEVGEERNQQEEAYEERVGKGEDDGLCGAFDSMVAVNELDGHGAGSLGGSRDAHLEEDEKKENEPFAVPTAGAFYMHDDRFRDNARGRHRQMHGGRRLWESKDSSKWGHDKFEELTLQERHYEEGKRTFKGHLRGRGRIRGMDHGYAGGSRSEAFNNNQNRAPKVVKGRGPRRYEPTAKNFSQAPKFHNKQSSKSTQKASNDNLGGAFKPISNIETEPVPAKKHVVASSLSSASPPFYPSGSSSKDISKAQKTDTEAGGTSKSLQTDESYSLPQKTPLLHRKNIVESTDRLIIKDSINQPAGKPLSNPQIPSSGSSLVNATQSSHDRVQGRGFVAGKMNYQHALPYNKVNRALSSTQSHQSPVQSRIQPAMQVSAKQLGHLSGDISQHSSSPQKYLTINSFEHKAVESSSESSQSKSALVGKAKGAARGSGAGSFICGGPHVIGATGSSTNVSHGDPNFPNTSAFLPVMQFGGQHPGGIGVPAVGMAFPGYVGQPQLGLGNSEMTWLPVLAGAAGALGATYCPPYITVDSSYHALSSGQTSNVGTVSGENNTGKPNNDCKPSEGTELVTDEFGQRQNKPRRYSEMNFSH